jgi:hypothetical protein
MSRRTRMISGIAAGLLLVAGAVPIAHAIDRAVPHAIVLWDTDQCAPSTAQDHSVFGIAGPVLPPGDSAIQVLDAHPLGVSPGARWRTWVVPVAKGAGWTGALGTERPPTGWAARMPAAGATVTADERAELDLEIWPGAGATRTSIRGFLVTYRTTFGIVRTAWTPTEVSTTPGGCA